MLKDIWWKMNNKPLKVGELTAEVGEKKQGYINILDTGLKIPITLINGIGKHNINNVQNENNHNEDSSPKTVVITSGIHGGEYTGIETSIRLAKELQPEDVNGKLIIVHPVNTTSFFKKNQYVVPLDGKNLNRTFPGKEDGSVADKISYIITNEMYAQADFVIDLHGGDLHEDLEPFVAYASNVKEEIVCASKDAARFLGIKYIVGVPSTNSSFGAAAQMGIPALLAEIGGRGEWTEKEVERYLEGVNNLLMYLRVLDGNAKKNHEELIELKEFISDNAAESGCWYPFVKKSDILKKGEKIGEIRDFFSNVLAEHFSEADGVALYIVKTLSINEGDPIYSIGKLS